MTRYFFESLRETSDQPNNGGIHRLLAIIDDQFYWSMTWKGDKNSTDSTDAEIRNFSSGFITSAISEECAYLEEVKPAQLHELFGSFSYYLERAVSGFKSYIAWISPDPQASNVTWKIPLN